MALFNHEITYDQIIENVDTSGLIVNIAYDDAFGVRREIHLSFPAEVDHVTVGGTATTSPTILTGLATGFDKDQQYVYVEATDGHTYECVFAQDEDITEGDAVLIADHMNHADRDMNEFDWLATKRAADFQLNSIKVIARDSGGVELCYCNVDPYTGMMNFSGMGI